MTCKHLFFEGRVQGVCFRDKVQKIARELKAIGWVRNLSDGRVEAVVNGNVEQMVKRIKELPFPIRVDKVIELDFAFQEFEGFKIRASK